MNQNEDEVPKIQKILVANRGEIACRVLRTAKRLGIRTVAIYSDIDRHSPHVKMADEAYHIGPNPSNESYLLGNKIIALGQEKKVDAIHPGYGFLSENAAFAEAVEEAGIKFIGPSAKAIEVMGDKLAAKAAISNFDIPKVPGTDEPVRDLEEAREIASAIGFPVLIKAAAGGGGKGMRLVKRAEDIAEQLERASSEAESAFGDGSVFIEKFIQKPRHIEIQVLADSFGHTVHLFERECSIQRRHQKVIEEAPSAVLTPAIRSKMGEAAVNVAKACQYEGAGTVEFLMDEDLNFYFLEMNTRLQVEHPVTEYITGIDLVEKQIEIAEGKALSIRQEEIGLAGHAIELRVYAEDPYNSFLPSIGTLEKYQEPTGAGIRVDSGFTEGMDIPIFYDPLLSKLIVYGKNRTEAIALMLKAIETYEIKGIETTLPFGEFVMRQANFISGDFDTNFVDKYFYPSLEQEMPGHYYELAAIVANKYRAQEHQKLNKPELSNNAWFENRKLS